LVGSLEKKIGEAEKKYEETSRISEERLKKATDAESKIDDLNKTMQRLVFMFFLHFLIFCFKGEKIWLYLLYFDSIDVFPYSGLRRGWQLWKQRTKYSGNRS
jgi:hypothetical protein